MADLMLRLGEEQVLALALVLLSGYLLGKIRFFGISFGGAGILLSALIFGHFGLELDSTIQDLGLACFVTAVGLSAGPDLFQNLKRGFKSYMLLALAIVGTGVLLCVGAVQFLDVPKELAVGLFSGALTSTPGLGAALEASGSQVSAVGYGVAYPFGVLCVVTFVQLMPRLLKADLNHAPTQAEPAQKDRRPVREILLDPHGLAFFAGVVLLGVVFSAISLPLPGGVSASLGLSGGLLLAGLLGGRFLCMGSVKMDVPKATLDVLKEAGMILFLAVAGTEAGAGFLDIVKEQGIRLFFIGGLMTLLPMLVGYFLARRLLSMPLRNSLGAICGGMTSTPALGSLLSVTDSNDVVVSYVATYPIALLAMVLFSHGLIGILP